MESWGSGLGKEARRGDGIPECQQCGFGQVTCHQEAQFLGSITGALDWMVSGFLPSLNDKESFGQRSQWAENLLASWEKYVCVVPLLGIHFLT